tara:strand:+ start:76 stop:591 length:516 start_codon:yes stop_codon:yes gene_type:complete
MRPKNVADYAEVISAVAVVISLFYLGYQVKQNTDAVRAVALNSVASDINTLFIKGLEKEIAIILLKSEKNTETLSDVEKEQLFNWFGLNVSIFEAAWRHKANRRITEEYFDTMIPIICSTYQSKAGLEFWFVWKDAVTQGYWHEVTQRCDFKEPDLSSPFYPKDTHQPVQN